MEVPTEWSQIQGDAWVDQGIVIGATIFAAPNLSGLWDWTGPGVGLMITDEYDFFGGIEGMTNSINNLLTEDCTFFSQQEYQAGNWNGFLNLYNACGAGNATMFAFIGTPDDHPGSYLAVYQFQALEERDVDAFTHSITHFTVIDELP